MEQPCCLVCGSGDVETFLDLGLTTLANKFPTAADLVKPEKELARLLGL